MSIANSTKWHTIVLETSHIRSYMQLTLNFTLGPLVIIQLTVIEPSGAQIIYIQVEEVPLSKVCPTGSCVTSSCIEVMKSKYYRQLTSKHEVEYSYVCTYIQQLRHGGQSRPTITDVIQFAMLWVSMVTTYSLTVTTVTVKRNTRPHIVDISTVIPVHDQCPLGAN